MSRIKPIKLTMAQKTALNGIRSTYGDMSRSYHQGNEIFAEFETAIFRWVAADGRWTKTADKTATAKEILPDTADVDLDDDVSDAPQIITARQ